jgi:hypothetical protein
MSLQPPVIETKPTDGPNVGAFGRERIASPFAVWDNKNIYNVNHDLWQERVNGGGSVAHIPLESSVGLTVGTASGDFAIRQTTRYHAYVPGKSQLIIMTAIMAAAQAGLVQRLGLFDDLNGPFFDHNGTNMGVVLRTNTSGSAVDGRVAQTAWNIDKMDGTGPSGKTADWTKSHIFIIDYQWLGVGRVRYGLDIDGEAFYVHEVLNANTLDIVYMQTPSLPIRYEIRNTAITTGATLKEVCSSVTSEGGYTLPGIERSISNDFAAMRSVGTTRTPVFAVRLKTSLGGKPNRKTARFLESNYYCLSKNCLFEMSHIHDATSITATWISAEAESGVEYSKDISAIVGGTEHVLNHEVVVAGQAGKGGSDNVTTEFVNNHSFISQNYESDNSELFVIFATSETASTCFGSIKFIEFE